MIHAECREFLDGRFGGFVHLEIDVPGRPVGTVPLSVDIPDLVHGVVAVVLPYDHVRAVPRSLDPRQALPPGGCIVIDNAVWAFGNSCRRAPLLENVGFSRPIVLPHNDDIV
jgi:hypothetical protein